MLEPLQTLLDLTGEAPGRLPVELARLYGGPLDFPAAPASRPYVVANFVGGVDGVVSYALRDRMERQPIFGDPHDRLVMGLLRLVCDTVMVGSRTLAAGLPGGTLLWSAILPREHREVLTPLFEAAETRLGLPRRRRAVIVTGSGAVDLRHPIFAHADVDAVIATTEAGRERLERALGRAARPRVIEISERAGRVDPRGLVAALWGDGARLVLSEGGPALHGSLERETLVDELFLTTTAWVPGQDPQSSSRPTFSGAAHAPSDTPRTRLLSVKRHGDVLFTRRSYVR